MKSVLLIFAIALFGNANGEEEGVNPDYYAMEGWYAQWLGCIEGYSMTMFCASGKHDDCSGGSMFERVGCTKSKVTNIKSEAIYGTWINCPHGEVQVSACSSKDWAGCGGQLSGMQCAKILDGYFLSEGYDHFGEVGWDIACKENFYVTGMCSSSMGGDCYDFRRGHGVSHRIRCERMTDCGVGHYCVHGSRYKAQPGYYVSGTIENHQKPCPAGQYCPHFEMAGGITCPELKYCPEGSIQPLECPAGSYCPSAGMGAPKPCDHGFHCSVGKRFACIPGTYCPINEPHHSLICPEGHTCAHFHMTAPAPCQKGFYCPFKGMSRGDQTNGISCPVGYECPNEKLFWPQTCAAGTYSDIPQLANCKMCPVGYFCPAGSVHPTPCKFVRYCVNNEVAEILGARKYLVCALNQAVESCTVEGMSAPPGIDGNDDSLSADCKSSCALRDSVKIERSIVQTNAEVQIPDDSLWVDQDKLFVQNPFVEYIEGNQQTLMVPIGTHDSRKKKRFKSIAGSAEFAPWCIRGGNGNTKHGYKVYKTSRDGIYLPDGFTLDQFVQVSSTGSVQLKSSGTFIFELRSKEHPKDLLDFKKPYQFSFKFGLNRRCGIESGELTSDCGYSTLRRLVFFGIGDSFVSTVFEANKHLFCKHDMICGTSNAECNKIRDTLPHGVQRECFKYDECATCSGTILERNSNTGKITILYEKINFQCPAGSECFSYDPVEFSVIEAERTFQVKQRLPLTVAESATQMPNKFSKIELHESGFCVTADTPLFAGQKVVLEICDFHRRDRQWFELIDGNKLRLRDTNFCLDIDGGGYSVQIWHCLGPSNDGNQIFTIHEKEIKSSDGRCLDLFNYNRVPGQPIHIYPCSGGVAQIFKFETTKYDISVDHTSKIELNDLNLCVALEANPAKNVKTKLVRCEDAPTFDYVLGRFGNKVREFYNGGWLRLSGTNYCLDTFDPPYIQLWECMWDNLNQAFIVNENTIQDYKRRESMDNFAGVPAVDNPVRVYGAGSDLQWKEAKYFRFKRKLYDSTLQPYNDVYETKIHSYFEQLRLTDCDISSQILQHPELLSAPFNLRHPIIELSHPDLEVTGLWYCDSQNDDATGSAGAATDFGDGCGGADRNYCRAQNFETLVDSVAHPKQVRFKWEKGCKNSNTFQIQYEVEKQVPKLIGGEYKVENDECSSEVVPGSQLYDDSPMSMFDFGSTQAYCISFVGIKTRPVCDSFVTPWLGMLESQVVPEGEAEDDGIEGVYMNAFLCEDVDCLKSSNKLTFPQHNTSQQQEVPYLSQKLEPNLALANQFSFDVLSSDTELLEPIELITDQCPTANHTSDFEFTLNDEFKLSWVKEFPLCWTLLDMNSGRSTSSLIHFKQEDKGGNVFDRHFDIMVLPDWYWLSKNCRKECGLCKSCSNEAGDNYCKFLVDIDDSSCTNLKQWLPTELLEKDFLDDEERIDIVGSTILPDTNCHPGLNQFSYFDTLEGWRCCVNGAFPAQYDYCMKRFTSCSEPNSNIPNPQTRTLEEKLKVYILSVSTSHSNDYNEQDGKIVEVSNTMSDSLNIDFKYSSKHTFGINNAWSGDIFRFKSDRADENGKFRIKFSSAEKNPNPKRSVKLFPSFSSEIHYNKNTIGYHHHFISAETIEALEDTEENMIENEEEGVIEEFDLSLRSFIPFMGDLNALKPNQQLYRLMDGYDYADFNWGDAFSVLNYITDDVNTTVGSEDKLLVGPRSLQRSIHSSFVTQITNVELTDRDGFTISALPPYEFYDSTLVRIKINLSYANTRGHCGVAGILFCGFHSSNSKMVHGSCGTTNENGQVTVRVPYGVKVFFDYACRYKNDPSLNHQDCMEEKQNEKEAEKVGKDSKVGRHIKPINKDGFALKHSPNIDTAIETEMEINVFFVDHTYHELDVVLGAGMFHYGVNGKVFKAIDDLLDPKSGNLNEGFNVDKIVNENKEFFSFDSSKYGLNLLHKENPECDIVRPNKFQKHHSNPKVVARALPLDITDQYYGEFTSQELAFAPVVDYFNSTEEKLQPLKVLGSNIYYLLFNYRVPAKMGLYVFDRDHNPISEDTNCDGIRYVNQTINGDKENGLIFDAQFSEDYTDVFNETKLSKVKQGLVTFIDDVAADRQSRVIADMKTKGKELLCSLATGCEDVSIWADDPINIHGFASYKITKLTTPSLTLPYYKSVRINLRTISPFPGQDIVKTEEEVKIIILGLAPFRMHQTIKVPEYIPFVILRKPPGDESSSTWTKDSTFKVEINLASSKGDPVELKAEQKADAGFDAKPSVNAPMIGKILGFRFVGDVSVVTEGSVNFDPKKHAVSKGNTIHISSNMLISTGNQPQWVGHTGDLFVVPSFTIKVVESFSVFRTGEQCHPEKTTVSHWLALDGSSAKTGEKVSLDDLVLENTERIDPVVAEAQQRLAEDSCDDYCKRLQHHLIKAAVPPALVKHEAHDILQHVLEDKAWNVATIHSVYHILNIRIPQLQRQCNEIRLVLENCITSYSSYFLKTQTPLTAEEKAKCPTENNTSSSINCDHFFEANQIDSLENKYPGDLKQRYTFVTKGINGWKKAIWFNEKLKENSEDNGFSMKQLMGSPVDTDPSRVPQPTDLTVENMRSGLEGFKQQALFHTASVLHNVNNVATVSNMEGGVASHVYDSISGKFSLDTGIDQEDGNGANPSSIIGFAGGGSSYQYSWKSTRSKALNLQLDSDYSLDWTEKAEVDLKSENTPSNAKKIEFSRKTSNNLEFSDEQTKDSEMDQNMEFVLQDSTPSDLFDVKITKDPLYGTPIFRTLGGRSNCPHEPNTDSNDNFQIRFSAIGQQFDEFDRNGNANFLPTLVKQPGETCVSVFVDVETLPPGGLGEFSRNLFVNQETEATSSLAGLRVFGVGNDLRPAIGDTTKQQYLLKFCLFDERILQRETFNNDGTTNPPGIFKNIDIVIESSCENDINPQKQRILKSGESITSQCDDDGYPVRGNQCETTELVELQVNGKTESFTLANEPTLSSKVTIGCIAFTDKCHCDNSCGTTLLQSSTKSLLRANKNTKNYRD